MTSIDPDSEENQAATRQHEREVFALQRQATQDAEAADAELRIAIATACGFVEVRQSIDGEPQLFMGWKTEDEDEQAQPVPDYTGSLDCMHEAEQTLTAEERSYYGLELQEITRAETDFEGLTSTGRFSLLHATARQRAQAFVRTIAARAEREASL